MGCSRQSRQLALIVVLIIVGLYFLIFHQDPLPLNHDAVFGKSDLHLYHSIIGIILIGGAVLVWRRSRTVTMPATPASTVKQ